MQKKWTDSDVKRLKEIYEKTQPCDTCSEFTEKVHDAFDKERTIASVQEMSRKLGLKPKKITYSVCARCNKDLSKGDSISMYCKKCYQAAYYEGQAKKRR